MTCTARAAVPTPNASRYLQQLCRHWGHSMAVEYDADHGRIVFPRNARGADWPGDAVVSLEASADALAIRVDASDFGQRTGICGAIERHLDRFAFREAPFAYHWQHAG